jgi:hypoxanthine phosphoribosyltransferase
VDLLRLFQISSLLVRSNGFTHGTSSDQQVSYKSAATERQTVLVVEDYMDTRETMKIILEDMGYRVVEAADGIEAPTTRPSRNARVAGFSTVWRVS